MRARLKEAEQKVLAGDFAGALPIFEQAAKHYRSRNRPRDMVSALVAAARLRMMLGQHDAAAGLLDRAVKPSRRVGVEAEVLHARAELADARGDLDARRRAWAAWLERVDGPQALGGLLRLAAIDKEAGRFDAMLPILDRVLAAARAQGDAGAPYIVEAHLERAAAQLASTAEDGASPAGLAVDLDAAEAALGDESGPQRARLLHLRALAARLANDPAALGFAKAAREAAVAATDLQAYLASALLIATLHDEAGDALRCFDTLVRARESIADLLGPDGRALVQPAVDAFEARLGPEAFTTLHTAWVEARQNGTL